MTPKEALDRLRIDSGDGEAWRVVQELLEQLAGGVTSDPARRAGAVTAVREKLQDQAIAGVLDEIHAPLAYLSTALRRKVIDQIRKEERTRLASERAREAERGRIAAQQDQPEALSPDVLRTLERVAERAISRRDPWQREHLRIAWEQIKALQLERTSLRELVIVAQGLPGKDAPTVGRGVQRAHKAHQRARAALAQALEELVEQGRLDRESAAGARAAIARLKRRQDPPASFVSGKGGGAS